MTAEQRLLELGLDLPASSAPAGNYATSVRTGALLFVSGRAPLPIDGRLPKGRLGREFSAAEGYAFARSACLDAIAIVRGALGSLDRVAQVVDLHGALNTIEAFEDHAKVLDGASDLLVAVFGPQGKHARSVAGVLSLRGGLPLTVKLIVEVKTD